MPPILHYSQPHTDRDLPRAAYALQGDPLAAGRVIHFHDPAQDYAVGNSTSVDANLLIEAFPWVELGIVEAGELRLQGEGFDLTLGAGDCFVVPRGVAVRWHHRGALRRLFVAFPGLEACAEMPRQPMRIDLGQVLPESQPPAANVLLTAAPRAWSQTLFSVANLRVGLWACEPYARRQVEPNYSELMFILEGAVEITAQAGDCYRVCKGETVFVPRGATNSWVSTEMVRKVFCILS